MAHSFDFETYDEILTTEPQDHESSNEDLAYDAPEDDSHIAATRTKGYYGDRNRKWIPPLNVADSGPLIVWQRFTYPRNALDFFLLFYPSHMMQTIIDKSNLYALHGQGISKSYMSQLEGGFVWRKIDLMEFRRFLACLLYMGIVKTPARENYWHNDSIFSGLLGSMFLPSFRRYCGILAALHCVDPSAEDSTDLLSKVRNVYDFIRSRCKELFIPRQSISIDERMVKSKGRFFFKQYSKNKPTKWGFKVWVLADSDSGYKWDMVVYTGKKRRDGWDDFSIVEEDFKGIPKGSGQSVATSSEIPTSLLSQLGARVVIKLTEPLQNMGYVLFVDNYYTSIPLVQYLMSVGIHAVGTIREKYFFVSRRHEEQSCMGQK